MNDKEYLMLREEILHLSTLENNTINFFYTFVSVVLVYAINKSDSLYTLISYVIIIPAYQMVWSKRKGICKIGAYLYVFQEGKKFNWERRSCKMYNDAPKWISSKIQSFNLPFLFVSTFVTIIFFIKTQWNNIGNTGEFIKVIIALSLYIMQLSMIIKHRKISIEKYIPIWKVVKNEE